LRVERERGITVKAQTASVIYRDKETNIEYLINLIDTPVSPFKPNCKFSEVKLKRLEFKSFTGGIEAVQEPHQKLVRKNTKI
jgi:hypothetical protein